MSTKNPLRLAFVLGALLLAGLGVAYAVRELRPQSKTIPTARVQNGTVELDIVTFGELRSPHSAMLGTPPVNGTLQIVHLIKTGTPVKTGEVVVEFDPSEQEFNLEQSRSQLEEAEQQIAKAKADAEVKTAEDKVALVKAKFDVRRAELEVSRNELVSEIDAKKNLLTLEESKRRLAQLQQDIGSRAASNTASLALLEQKRQTSLLGMQQAQQNINNMKIKAPMDGLVSIKENMDASGGFFFGGMTLPEYREGDLVQQGRILAEVLDVRQMEALAKVNENDRSNVNVGQTAELRLEAQPQPTYPAKVKSVAALASRRNWGTDAIRRFDVSFDLMESNAAIRPGTSAQIVIRGNQLKDKLYLPAQCVFEKDGKPVVFVKHQSKFEPTEVKIAFRTENRVVVENLNEGTEVALVNPEEQKKRDEKKDSSAPMGVGR